MIFEGGVLWVKSTDTINLIIIRRTGCEKVRPRWFGPTRLPIVSRRSVQDGLARPVFLLCSEGRAKIARTDPFAYLVQKQWSLWARGGRPRIWKKSEKMRFYKSCHTLSTIQPRKKTQLTKVVSPPKRFCGPLEARCANRIFCLKNQPLRRRPPRRDSQRPQRLIFEGKNAISAASFHRTTKPFLGRNNLSKLHLFALLYCG